ncbi:hypothetical protein MXD62_23360 [Frankia sp. Mgl5]|uniref:anti-sigma factor family protein n=1 Tax=Frankia sp. Mgl5 TaxID=2933793 RepID=UPI00200FC1C7|nr:hypothetical protein [Frankia sp. Mgl5]MCK9930068.1 hypothetical protein [Frankia sp. Mgl5]
MVTDEHGAHAPDPGWRPGDRGPRTRAGTAAQRMTDGRTTGGHPDVEALDAYLDARPDPSDQGFPLEPAVARVERHVHSCATCQEALTALRRVRADLARLASMTMPADVAERIQAALAARSATDTRARESARSGRGPRAGAVSGPPRPRRRLGRVGSLPASGLVAPGEFERKSTPGNAGRGTAGTGPDAADHGSGIAEQGTAGPGIGEPTIPAPDTRTPDTKTPGARTPGARAPDTTAPDTTAPGIAEPDIAAHGTTRGNTEPGRPPISGAPRPQRPPRHGGRRRRGGLAGAGGRVARDWVSIAATCVALVAFGAAVLTLRGLTAGGGDASSTAASDAATALSGASQTAGPEAARAPGPAAAAAVPSASGTPEEPSAAFTMVADSGEAVRAGDIVVHGRSLLTGRIPTTMLTWSVLPALSGATSVPPAAGEEQATDGGASTTVSGTDSSAAPATTPETLARVIDTPQLRMCYDSLTAQTGGSVLALDRVRFDGQRALLVVLSVAGQPAAARVVVIDARCGVVPMPGAVLYTVNTTRAL